MRFGIVSRYQPGSCGFLRPAYGFTPVPAGTMWQRPAYDRVVVTTSWSGSGGYVIAGADGADGERLLLPMLRLDFDAEFEQILRPHPDGEGGPRDDGFQYGQR